jgi:single-strand DNA-binding protein
MKDGVKTEITEWHNIIMWRNLAEVAEKYVRKGSLIYIEGKIRSRSYDDKEGIKRYVYEIIADTMNLVGPRPEGAQQAMPPQTASVLPIETTDLGAVPNDLPF